MIKQRKMSTALNEVPSIMTILKLNGQCSKAA